MDPEEFFIPEWTTPVSMPGGAVVDGIFDKQHLQAAFDIPIDANAPQVALLSSDADGLNDGDPLIISGKQYRSKGFEPDGQGITIVKLEGPF